VSNDAATAPGTGLAGSRADAQRERILSAARRCFIEHGFHAASMASIAEAAQMSAGLMYRYFENKQAIVLAIVERQLDENRAALQQLSSSRQFTDGLIQAIEQWRSGAQPMSPGLYLEISAQASRNPQIAAALRRSDEVTRAGLQAWLESPRSEGGFGMCPDAAATRALLLRSLFTGLALHAARDPDADLERLKAAIDDVLSHL